MQSSVIPPAEEHHRKGFPGTALGMAPLPLTNGVHMWLLFIPCSLMLPFPPKPGQVCSWVHLVSPGWVFVPSPAVPEGLGGSKVSQGSFRVSPAHRAVSPVQRAAPSGTFPPPQQCQQGGHCCPEPGQASAGDEGDQGWGHREHQNLLLPVLEQWGDTGGDTVTVPHLPSVRALEQWGGHCCHTGGDRVTVPHLPSAQASEQAPGHEPEAQIYPHKQAWGWELTAPSQGTPEELQGLNSPQL